MNKYVFIILLLMCFPTFYTEQENELCDNFYDGCFFVEYSFYTPREGRITLSHNDLVNVRGNKFTLRNGTTLYGDNIVKSKAEVCNKGKK